ncbi:hypothetical protein Rhe02_56140 [Rhizocola hellebori]|uniref:DUF4259 domain-containing protein n=1 Tax=Rhizocola hellebori TaxID=1392758 RepID=A0A8J3QCK6_9ACTN|nr:DUF4259 domain-containing protein [Rhizocola hellebori]GIH07547.1 hypothetical protein Rhe02_56140 [Rhizocola hellebori]
MGTWGPGPFDSDGARDLIDFMAQRSPDERRHAFHGIFADAMRLSDDDVDLHPSDVIAAVALIAMSVPGGPEQLGEIATEKAAAGIVAGLDPQLATEALVALAAMSVPGNDWYDTWIEDDPEGEAAQSAQAVTEVLRVFVSESDGRRAG